MDDMWQNLFQDEGNIWFSYQMIIFDEVPAEKEVIKLIRDAFKSGLVKQEAIDSWENEGIENEVRIITSKLRETPYLRIELKDGWLYYGSYGYAIIRNYPELRVIKYSEAKDYLINESEEDDFAWITDVPLNPWLEYDAIIFDKKPKKKKLNNYIELALSTKNPSNKESWEIGRKGDIESILRYTKKYGEAVLMVDGNNNLVYSDPSYYDSKTINSIKYSQLVNKKINESEDDEWSWITNEEIFYPVKSVNDLKIGQKYYIDYRVGYDDERLGVPVIFRGYPDKFSNTFQFVGEDENGVLRNYLFFAYSYGGGLVDMINKGQVTYKTSEHNTVNESEEYGLEWIKGIKPISVGTVFRPVYERSPEQAFYYVIESIDDDIITFRYPTTPNGDYDGRRTSRGIITVHELLDKIGEGKISIIDNITESEEDEWAWAKESIFVDKVSMGDRVRVYNTGSEKAFLYWLGGYRENYENGLYGKYIEGVVIAEEEEAFGLSVKGHKGDADSFIYFPYKSHMEFLESIDEGYEGLSISYEIIFKA